MITKQEVLKSLKLKGICIIPSYWTKEKCNIAIREISSIHKSKWIKGQGGDMRCRPADKFSNYCHEFLHDRFLNEIARAYSECNRNDSVQANIVKFEDGKKIDSGGGWHVDSIGNMPQFKTILYLSEVGEKNGPFLFIPNTKNFIKEVPMYGNNRIDESYINSRFFDSIIKVTAGAGTCIIVDTTNIHRGDLILENQRIALTTYFYKSEK